jgi:hypothetical protein
MANSRQLSFGWLPGALVGRQGTPIALWVLITFALFCTVQVRRQPRSLQHLGVSILQILGPSNPPDKSETLL